MLSVLVACEMSGRVRSAFAKRGWDAWSCDLLPDESEMWCEEPGGRHAEGDVLPILRESWDLIICHPPCFPAETPVLTARGVIGIEAVREGDLVLTHEGRWKPVTATMSRESEVVSDGVTTCTPDHPFYSRSPGSVYVPHGDKWQSERSLGRPGWTPAAALEGEFVATPVRADSLPFSCPVNNPAVWYAIGRWLGDGWTRNEQRYRNGQPNGHSTEVIICSSFEEADELGVNLKETGLNWVRSKQRTTVRFTLSNTSLTHWLEAEFGKYAHGKTVPAWLLGAEEGVRQEVLRGYLDADGSEQRGHLRASTVSPNLAVGIRVLASTLGYTTSMYLRKFNGKPYAIEGRSGPQRDSYSVVIREDDGRFTELTEQHRWIKQRKPFLPVGRSTVYDITVADDHSFVANGFVVHNCTDLSQAGARYWKQKQEDGRQHAAVQFFLKMFDYANKGAYVVVENPNGIMSRPPVGRVPDQVVQPWMFGDPLIKETHLWYRDANESIGWYRDSLPHLIPTHTLADYPQTTLGRTVTGGGSWRTDKKNGKVGMNKNWEDSQGRARRNILRSITPQGLAQAFADQWGAYVESKRVL